MKDFAFSSSGDPEEDARTAAAIRRHEANMAEGLCPNGCAPLERIDAHNQRCPICGFVHWSNVPRSE